MLLGCLKIKRVFVDRDVVDADRQATQEAAIPRGHLSGIDDIVPSEGASLPHPGLARAWPAASPPSSPPSQAPSSQPQHPTPASGAHPAAAAADAADDDGAAYSEVNSLLRSLHLERVAKGRQKEWVEDEE